MAGESARAEIDGSIFNPFAPEFVRDPHPVWQRLLAEYPVAWHRDLNMWVVSSHALCAEMLKDNARYTPNYRVWEHAPAPRPPEARTDFDRMTDHALFMADRAGHHRLRKLTLPAFSGRVMAQIDARIHDLIVSRFEEIGRPARFDVFAEIAEPVPARSIARMIGVPMADEALFQRFANAVVLAARINLPQARREAAMDEALEGIAYFQAEIARRRAQADPGDDFLGSLISARDGDDSLDDWDIIALISALITAGADTAIDLHTYLVKGLLEHPDQQALLRAEPALMDSAIVELIRHGAMGKFPFFRFATQDSELAGQRIGKGQAILVNLTAAWHDPARWPQPQKLDFTREMDGNLVFGAGPHFCVGAYLVKAQARIMLEEFLRRFPDATLVDGGMEYDDSHHNARRISRLLIETGAQRQQAVA